MSISDQGYTSRYVLWGREDSSQFIRTLMSWMFVAFCFYVFTDGTPFKGREISDLSDFVANSDEGDKVRQIFYLSIAGLVFYASARKGLGDMVRAFPMSIMLLFGWCFLTVFWAVVPEISVRRVVLAFIIVYSTITIIYLLGAIKVMDLLYKVLTILLIINFLSVILVPGLAIHSAMERDADLIGAWHGAMPHKNIASAVSALSCIFFGYRAYVRRSIVDAILMILSVVFLIGTKGKTALGILIPCLISAILYTYAYRLPRHRIVVMMGLFFGTIIIALLIALFGNVIAGVLSDPDAFTGRVSIWQIVLRYSEGHLLAGSGFGSFWLIGGASPILRIGGDRPWLFGVAHSHNGYLEMLVTTGIPGLALTILCFVILPFYRFFVAPVEYRNLNGLCFGVWMFCVLYNLLETQLLNRDRQVWVIMLVVVTVNFLIHEYVKRQRRAGLPL